MTLEFPVLATALLLASGLALAEPAEKMAAVGSSVATVVGAGASGATAAKPAQLPVSRAREDVRAEAVDAVREHRSTFARDLDFLKN